MDGLPNGIENRSLSHRFHGLGTRDKIIIGVSLIAASCLIVDPLVLRAVQDVDGDARAFFRFITDIGKSGWMLLVTGLAFLAFLYLKSSAKTLRLRAAFGYAAQLAGFVFLTSAVAGLAGSLIKNIIGRARPKLFDDLGSIDFSPFAFKADFASLPSGHATTIFALAATLAILWPAARVPLFTAAAWIAASRVLVGAHYLADVLAGALLGTGVAYLIRDRLAARRWLFVEGPEGPVLRGRRLGSWIWRQTVRPHLERLTNVHG